MRPLLAVICLLPFAWSGIAAAQNLPANIPDNLTSAGSISSAAKTLAEAGVDKLLIRDLLGKKLTGSDGTEVGTIENFAVIPGGRIVAALVTTSAGPTLAVPFAAIKVANAAGTANLSVPVPASELQGMSELQSLASTLAD